MLNILENMMAGLLVLGFNLKL
jgi:hypothetical protein